MKVAYMSITGNCKRFVDNLGFESIEITPINPLIEMNEDYVVVAPTYDREITEPINEFIEHGNNKHYLKGVVGSGNYNFDDLYIFTAKDLSDKYNTPLLHDFEYFGTDMDVDKVKEELNAITRAAK